MDAGYHADYYHYHVIMGSGDQLPHFAYEPVAEEYASEQDDPAMRARCREMFLQSLSGKRVLDIGCGPGHDSAELQSAGCDVTAIDLCESFLSYGKRTYPNVDFQCMNMKEPTFPPNSFDGVIGMFCLCHATHDEITDFITKYYDIVNRSGSMLFTLGDSEKVDGYTVEDWCGVDGNRIHMYCHNRNTLKTAFKDSGFDKVTVHPLQSPYYDEMPRLQDYEIKLYAINATKS
mgnify:CR=1 FL=1